MPGEEFRRLLDQGNEIALGLVGLTERDAREQAKLHPDHHVVFIADGAAVTADLRANRIRACLREGVVVGASAG